MGASARFLDQAADVASYYGFRPLRDVDAKFGRKAMRVSFPDAVFAAAASRAASKRVEPLLSYYASPAPSHVPGHLQPRETAEFGLLISGTRESIGEILAIKTSMAVLAEWGHAPSMVRVNSFGDRDSKLRYARELGNFLRRRVGSELESLLPQEERAHLYDRPLSAFHSKNEQLREILREAPRPMHFLSEKSRTHFCAVLEHLENIGMPYELDDSLVGDERDPHIVFRIDLPEEQGVGLMSLGGRYDEFAEKISQRKDSATVHASIFFRRKKAAEIHACPGKAALPPKLFFIRLGAKAKLRGLDVIDVLREARVPVSQTFDTSRLSPQLQAAREQLVPYVLIMGEREARDGTVIVRSMRNSSQDIVELSRLPRYVKTLRV